MRYNINYYPGYEYLQNQEVICFGAGQFAQTCIPVLKQFLDIKYVIDNAEDKQGKTIYGKPIRKLRDEQINNKIIIVTTKNPEIAIAALRNCNCLQRIFFFRSRFEDDTVGYVLYEYNEQDFNVNSSFPTYPKEAVIVRKDDLDYFCAEYKYSQLQYDNKKTRVFDIAVGNYNNPGGPCACVKNLHIVNEQYEQINNLISICSNIIITPKNYLLHTKPFVDDSNKKYDAIKIAKDINPEFSYYLYERLEYIFDFLIYFDSIFRFQYTDKFLIQDSFTAYAFIILFPDLKNIIHAYHLQGSLYSELCQSSVKRPNVYDYIQLECAKKINNWIFPSQGAKNGFTRTSTEKVITALNKNAIYIAYNGYTPKKKLNPDENFSAFLETLKQYDLVFATATHLYKNKGVERVPSVLSEIKNKTGLSIHWVLIGNGEKEEEVAYAIKKYLLSNEVTWYKERFENQDNVFALFEHADFYILMHRVSVFDLSTLQAMAYGTVPILSNIDGNKELCAYKNGILYNLDQQDRLSLANTSSGLFSNKAGVFDTCKLNLLKTKNKSVVAETFNDENFLMSYVEVLNNI